MGDTPQDSTPLERRLRALLAEEGEALRIGGAPHAEIVHQGRRARRRRRTVIGAGLSVLLAVPAVGLAAQSFSDTSPHPSSAAAGGTETGPPAVGEEPSGAADPSGDPAGDPADGQPLAPSDPERQLLDGITLAEARAQVVTCLEERHDPAAWPDGDRLDIDPADLQILLAWQGHGGENQGPGPIRRVLAVSVAGTVYAELICNKSLGGTHAGSGMQSAVGPWPERSEPVGLEWRRYHTPETGLSGDWSSELPFRWAFFNHVDEESVDKVTVEYGGETHEALIDGGFYLTSGVLDTAPDAEPRVLGYDADGEVIFDSRDHLPAGG